MVVYRVVPPKNIYYSNFVKSKKSSFNILYQNLFSIQVWKSLFSVLKMKLVHVHNISSILGASKKLANPNILSTTYLTFSNTNFYVLQTCITQSRERRGLMKSTKEFWSKKQFDKSSHYSDWLISRNHHSKGRNGVILTIYFHFVYILLM